MTDRASIDTPRLVWAGMGVLQGLVLAAVVADILDAGTLASPAVAIGAAAGWLGLVSMAAGLLAFPLLRGAPAVLVVAGIASGAGAALPVSLALATSPMPGLLVPGPLYVGLRLCARLWVRR